MQVGLQLVPTIASYDHAVLMAHIHMGDLASDDIQQYYVVEWYYNVLKSITTFVRY